MWDMGRYSLPYVCFSGPTESQPGFVEIGSIVISTIDMNHSIEFPIHVERPSNYFWGYRHIEVVGPTASSKTFENSKLQVTCSRKSNHKSQVSKRFGCWKIMVKVGMVQTGGSRALHKWFFVFLLPNISVNTHPIMKLDLTYCHISKTSANSKMIPLISGVFSSLW